MHCHFCGRGKDDDTELKTVEHFGERRVICFECKDAMDADDADIDPEIEDLDD